MSTKAKSKVNSSARAEHVEVNGRHVVVLDEGEYERLLKRADEWEPLLPRPNTRGNYPMEALDVLLARDILRHRRRLGLSQAELARHAGIRPETLNRIEQGKRSPSVRTVDKIDRALRQIEAENKLPRPNTPNRRSSTH
jgi:DNA-binding XRE family transcriptional regulator